MPANSFDPGSGLHKKIVCILFHGCAQQNFLLSARQKNPMLPQEISSGIPENIL
jgi:hypothetical protein